MSEVQVIVKNGKPVFYVLPAALWERVRDKVEDAKDVAAFDQAVANDDGVRYPSDVANALAEGVHPLKAWREHRGLTQDALALTAGVSKPFVSQIECRKREGTTATMKKLAGALGITLNTLTDF